MAQANWSILSGSLGAPEVQHGVTAGIARPSGGGSNLYGFNSVEIVDGAIAFAPNLVNFAPMAKGGVVSAALKRGIGGGPTGFAPFLYIGLQGTAIGGMAYILGLSDADPYHIELRKGVLTGGLPDEGVNPAAGNRILLKSSEGFEPDTWHHLRLDMIVQGTDDVLLQCFFNDLNTHPVTNPVWQTVPGMEGPQSPTIVGFVDDALGVNTGSAPLINGRAGFGMQISDVTRRGYVDHIEVRRQL